MRTQTSAINLLIISVLCLMLATTFGRNQATAQSYAKARDQLLFKSDRLLNIKISSNFSGLLSDMEDQPEYRSAVISYPDSNGRITQLPARLKVRGNFRLDPEHCKFPPILVNFKKEDVKGTLFNNQDKLKLVTPCQNEKYVLREYMIYKLYNLVTQYSFRVRLMSVDYFDSTKNKSLFTRYSFFLEDNDLMAERNGKEITRKFYNPYQLNRQAMIYLDLFEFMIGNNDWWITSHKNIYLIVGDSTEAPVPVPYDFDMSGFVDANYAKPEGVPAYRLIDPQFYKGICMTDTEKKNAFDYFISMKPEFTDAILHDPLYPKSLKNQSIDYLDRFYHIIRNPELVKTEIDNKCMKYQDYVKFNEK